MIFLVEDDDNIRKLICYALNKEGYEIEGFCSAKFFWQALGAVTPELVLLDIMLPEEDGLSVLRRLQANERYRNIPVIMLTAKDSEFDKATGLDMGADDYIAKPFGMIELISRINAVLRRYKKTKTESKNVFKTGCLYADFDKYRVEVGGEEIQLSNKEYSLLKILLKAKGNVVTREELFDRVWGEFYGESRTLDVHIRMLRVKLKEARGLIKTVKGIGYRLAGGENE